MTDQTIVDGETKRYLNTLTPNTVREYATAFWPHVSAADWDGKNLFLGYGPDRQRIKRNWYKCSGLMAKSLAEWIMSKN